MPERECFLYCLWLVFVLDYPKWSVYYRWLYTNTAFKWWPIFKIFTKSFINYKPLLRSVFGLPGFDKSQWLVFILLQHDTQFIFLDELFGSAERLPQWAVQPLPLWKRSVEKLDQKPIISDLSKCTPIKNRLSYKVRNHECFYLQITKVYGCSWF